MTYADEFIPTRKSLLSRLKNLDDQESWRVFFDTYWKLIFKAAIRAGLTESEAEDVVQDTVFSVSRSIGKFHYDPARGSFKGYLMNLTNWRIIRQFKKRLPVGKALPEKAADTTTDALDPFATPVPPALEELWDQEWESNLLEAAVQSAKANTDPKLYQAFDLHINQNWPAAKVAEDLHISRARVYLARRLVSRFIKSEVARLRSEPL